MSLERGGTGSPECHAGKEWSQLCSALRHLRGHPHVLWWRATYTRQRHRTLLLQDQGPRQCLVQQHGLGLLHGLKRPRLLTHTRPFLTTSHLHFCLSSECTGHPTSPALPCLSHMLIIAVTTRAVPAVTSSFESWTVKSLSNPKTPKEINPRPKLNKEQKSCNSTWSHPISWLNHNQLER